VEQPRTAVDASGGHRVPQSRTYVDAGSRGLMTIMVSIVDVDFQDPLVRD